MRPVKFEELSGNTDLFLDFINCTKKSLDFFGYCYRDIESYKSAAARIDARFYQREKVARILAAELESKEASDKTMANIGKLARADSLVVFAGQQVGMLLGPLYTVIKALTAYKLAAKLEAELGRPVVPCFWLASDDHDFDEIKTAKFLDRNGECKSVAYEPAELPSRLPMADIMLDGRIDQFLDGVGEALVETEFSADVLALVRKCYSRDTAISSAFTRLFNSLLGDFGIVPVDPNFPGLKELMSPIFRIEIDNHARIFQLFESRSREIIDNGYHRQVHKSPENLNLFYNEGGRRNIVADNGNFKLESGNKSLTTDELRSLLNRNPGRFSPNVLLRAIAQCHAIPTICQITGPSEAAYFAQIMPLFDFMEVPRPVVRPRIFATIMEPQVARNVGKLSIDFSSLYNDIEGHINKLITENYPPEIQRRAESLRPEVLRPLNELAESMKKNEPEGFQALERSVKKIDHEMNLLSSKLFAIHKKKHETIRNQIYRAAEFLFPEGRFQERVLSPVYFADKFGPDVFKKIESELDIDSADHQVVEI